MKPKNIKEAEELIKRYETITLEEIKGNFDPAALTGFGGNDCSLCIPIASNCYGCIYIHRYGCLHDENRETYNSIEDATTPLKLRNAFRARAKHIRKVLENLES